VVWPQMVSTDVNGLLCTREAKAISLAHRLVHVVKMVDVERAIREGQDGSETGGLCGLLTALEWPPSDRPLSHRLPASLHQGTDKR
jgi:hypothetical protein